MVEIITLNWHFFIPVVYNFVVDFDDSKVFSVCDDDLFEIRVQALFVIFFRQWYSDLLVFDSIFRFLRLIFNLDVRFCGIVLHFEIYRFLNINCVFVLILSLIIFLNFCLIVLFYYSERSKFILNELKFTTYEIRKLFTKTLVLRYGLSIIFKVLIILKLVSLTVIKCLDLEVLISFEIILKQFELLALFILEQYLGGIIGWVHSVEKRMESN